MANHYKYFSKSNIQLLCAFLFFLVFVIIWFNIWEFLLIGIFWFLALLFWAGLFSNIKNSINLIKAHFLKKIWKTHTIQAKVCWFRLDYRNKEGEAWHRVVASDWEQEYISEAFKSHLFGYNVDERAFLASIWINYNPFNLEETLQEVKSIQTEEDLNNNMNKNSINANKIFGVMDKINSISGIESNNSLSKKFQTVSMERLRNYEKSLESQLCTNSPQKPYIKIYNNKLLYIWDYITVHVNPKNNNIYEVDTNFLH